MKHRIITFISIVLIMCFSSPLFSFAYTINEEAGEQLYNSGNYEKVCPDMHYILDEQLPYYSLFLGNNNFVVSNSGSANYQLADYDLLFVSTAGAIYPMTNNAKCAVISGDNKAFSIYACHFEDNEWTPIVINGNARFGLYVTNDSETNWQTAIVGSNYDILAALDRQPVEPLDYLTYIYNGEYSFIDLNGRVTAYNLELAYLKMISHFFVRKLVNLISDIIINEPILFIICTFGVVVSVVSFLYSCFLALTRRKRSKRGG